MRKDPVETAMEAWLAGDRLKAESLLLSAARAGSGHAAHNLGTLYAIGGPGVAASIEKSRAWYQVSLDSGFEATVASDPEWFKR